MTGTRVRGPSWHGAASPFPIDRAGLHADPFRACWRGSEGPPRSMPPCLVVVASSGAVSESLAMAGVKPYGTSLGFVAHLLAIDPFTNQNRHAPRHDVE